MTTVKRWSIIAILFFLGTLGVWLFFRQIMVLVGLWQGSTDINDALVQLINVLYLLLGDGLWSAGILLAATLCGMGLLRWCCRDHKTAWSAGVPSESEDRGRLFILGAALGLGVLSLAVFLLAWAGVLQRWVYIGLLMVMAIPDLIWLSRQHRGKFTHNSGVPAHDRGIPMLALVLIPLVTLALLAAMLPAGILWQHDGRGFDALEYHLQLPREYLQMGGVGPVDHNVYSNFPANMEMLYLLGMILKGSAVEGMYLGQILNFFLAVLFIAGVYLLLKNRGKTVALVAAIAAAGPQLFFAATNAYVECYLLLMGLAALACTAYGANPPSGKQHEKPATVSFLLAGIFTGLACGCKYTALIMILPVTLIFGFCRTGGKVKNVVLILLGTIISFSPWLIKNMIYRGNPIFPLATNYLGRDGWTAEQSARWQTAHQPSAADAPWPARGKALAREFFSPVHYVALPILAVVGLVVGGARIGRGAGPALAGTLAVIIAWTFFTHLQSRFLLPIILPGVFLVANCAPAVTQTSRSRLWVSLAVVMAAASTIICAAAYDRNTRGEADSHGFLPLAGRDDIVANLFPFSDSPDSPPATTVLLVGESRPFYIRCRYRYNTVFDQNPLAQMLQEGEKPADILRRLSAEGITHLYVNWDEVNRLRKYYQFSPAINRDNFERLLAASLRLNSWHPAGGQGNTFQLYEISKPSD